MKQAIIVMGVALMMLSLMPIYAMGSESAELPQWNVGEKWAIGYEDSMKMGDDQLENVSEIFEQAYNVTDLSLSGESYAGTWMAFEVVGDEGSMYTLHYRSALKVDVKMHASFTASMPVAGTYNYDSLQDAQKESRQMSTDLSYSLYLVAEGDVLVEKSTMGISNVTTNLQEKFSVALSGKGLPSVGDYGIFGYLMMYDNYSMMSPPFELSYQDVDMSLTQTFNMNLWSSFQPAMKLADFPLYEGKVWNQTVSARAGGTYSGEIDASGLPSMIQDSVHLATGQKFPVKIEDINTGSPVFNYGKITGIEDSESISLGCHGTKQISDENGAQTTVFLIGVPEDNSCADYTAGYSAGYANGTADSSQSRFDIQPGGSHSDEYTNGYYSGYYAGYYGGTYNATCPSHSPSLPIYLMYSPDKQFFAGVYVDSQSLEQQENSMESQNGEFTEVFSAFRDMSPSEKTPDELSFMDYDTAMHKISSTESEMDGESPFLSTSMIIIILTIIVVVAVMSALVIVRKRKAAEPLPVPEETAEYPEYPHPETQVEQTAGEAQPVVEEQDNRPPEEF